MYTIESLEKYTKPTEFIYLNNEENLKELEEECNKLIYLKTYPSVVRVKIREKLAEIRGIENELEIDIRSKTSELARIKRRQELKPSYQYLAKLKDELRIIKDELVYAENVKLIAGTRLAIYQKFLTEYVEKQKGDNVNGSSRHKKQYRLGELPEGVRAKYN